MSKERLSKLQKWILKQCLKNTSIHRKEIREFWGKKLAPSYANRGEVCEEEIESKMLDKSDFNPQTYQHPAGDGRTYNVYVPKEELISTEAIEASISRSIKNLLEKDLLKHFTKHVEEGLWILRYRYCLTDKGFREVNKKSS